MSSHKVSSKRLTDSDGQTNNFLLVSKTNFQLKSAIKLTVTN